MKPLRILNWNVGGAKYLELPSGKARPYEPGTGGDFACREEYRTALNAAIRHVIDDAARPPVICLQEIVQYAESGNADPNKRTQILDTIPGYHYYPLPLIETAQFGARAKWLKVIKNGKWCERSGR